MYRYIKLSSSSVSSLLAQDSWKICYKKTYKFHAHLQGWQNAMPRLCSTTSKSQGSKERKQEQTSGGTSGDSSKANRKVKMWNPFDLIKKNPSSSGKGSEVASVGSYSALYSFQQIINARRILRLQYVITPYSWYLMWSSSFAPYYMTFSVLSTTVTVTFLLFIPQVVMKLSVGKTGETIDTAQISTLTLLGSRKNSYYKISDIVPLMELPAITTKDWYIPFLIYGEKRRRFLFLRCAKWEDHATFKRIMGKFPEQKKIV